MKTHISVIYNIGTIDPHLDERIKSGLHTIGCSYYGSGFNMQTKERTIVFDCPIEPPSVSGNEVRK